MIQKNINIKHLNTFRLDIETKLFFSLSDIRQLDALYHTNIFQVWSPLILGGGSNILFTNNYPGIMIYNELVSTEKVEENNAEVVYKFGAGNNWHKTVLFCISQGLFGIENLSLIPGTIGAAPIQNIGAYGVELESVFEKLDAFNLATGKIETITKKEMQFGYRSSIFKHQAKGKYIILFVYLKLKKSGNVNTDYGDIQQVLTLNNIQDPTPKDVSDAVIQIRSSKLPNPAELGNCGSFFKNPVVENSVIEQIQTHYPDIKTFEVNATHKKIPAAWLIEKAGWKGKRIGNVGMHEKQALVLVNYGKATGTELWNYAQNIIKDVHSKFGILLEAEVNVF